MSLSPGNDVLRTPQTDATATDARSCNRKLNCRRRHRQRRMRARNRHQLMKLCAGLELSEQPPKNALMQLHELRRKSGRENGQSTARRLKFVQISRSGPDHSPIFTAILEFNEQLFTGRGLTKRSARQSAAELALGSIVQFRHQADKINQMRLLSKSTHYRPYGQPPGDQDDDKEEEDFTRDDDVCSDAGTFQLVKNPIGSHVTFGSRLPTYRRRPADELTNHVHVPTRSTMSTSAADAAVPMYRWYSPQAILNDLRPEAVYRVIDEVDATTPEGAATKSGSSGECELASAHSTGRKGSPRLTVTVSLTVDGRCFIGTGRTPKQAKRRAAAEALHVLFNFRHLVG